jgi:hypothetical protein
MCYSRLAKDFWQIQDLEADILPATFRPRVGKKAVGDQ